MDKFLERYNLPRLYQEEIEDINRPITSNDIDTVLKNLPTNKGWGLDGFTGKFYEIFREDLTLILLNLFQKIAEGGTLPNSFYMATITLIPKPNKDTTKKKKKERKLQPNITDEHRRKNPQQNTSKQNPTTHQKDHTPWNFHGDTVIRDLPAGAADTGLIPCPGGSHMPKSN